MARQCILLGLSRSSLYWEPKGESEVNLALMWLVGELYVEHSFHGSR